MSPKDLAVQDIQEDLRNQNKAFIAFRKDLNPIMRKLVSKQLKRQADLNVFNQPSHSNAQLVARCLFAKGEAKLNNYTKYYKS